MSGQHGAETGDRYAEWDAAYVYSRPRPCHARWEVPAGRRLRQSNTVRIRK